MIGNLSTSLQSSRAGDYQESASVNGHPSWINAKNAIWFFDVFDDWVVGDIKKRGLIFRGLKTDNQGGSECPFDITATKWSFWNGTKWNSVGAGELSLHCSLAKCKNKYFAHIIEQPNFRVPNPQYLQRNFCFDFSNDSENTF